MKSIKEKIIDKLEGRVPINEIHKKNKLEKFIYKIGNALRFKYSIYTFKRECDFCSIELTDDTVVSVVIEKKLNFSLIKHEEMHKCPNCNQHWEYDNYNKKEIHYKNIDG